MSLFIVKVTEDAISFGMLTDKGSRQRSIDHWSIDTVC